MSFKTSPSFTAIGNAVNDGLTDHSSAASGDDTNSIAMQSGASLGTTPNLFINHTNCNSAMQFGARWGLVVPNLFTNNAECDNASHNDTNNGDASCDDANGDNHAALQGKVQSIGTKIRNHPVFASDAFTKHDFLDLLMMGTMLERADDDKRFSVLIPSIRLLDDPTMSTLAAKMNEFEKYSKGKVEVKTTTSTLLTPGALVAPTKKPYKRNL